MFIILAIVFTALGAWAPIILGVDSFAIAFIGGLCGLIIALVIYLISRIYEVEKDQAEILRRLKETKNCNNENGQNS